MSALAERGAYGEWGGKAKVWLGRLLRLTLTCMWTGVDDFEVSIFLTELSTRHSILTKRKVFKSEKPRLGNTDGRMTGETRDRPVEIGGEEEGDGQGVVIREEEDEEEGKEGVRLRDIPAAAADEADGKDGDLGGKEESGASSKKRRRGDSREEDAQEEEEEEEEPLFLSDDSAISDTEFQAQTTPPAKRHKPTATTSALENEEGAASDEKKKMALNTTYDGYAIYGRILCLIVKRRGVAARGKEAGGGTGQAVMEEWVRSTQVGGGEEEE